MKDTERNTLQAAAAKASALAEVTSESFVLAVTAAYMAGLEAGKKPDPQPMPPAA